jgi:predicted small secreted protein
MSFVTKRMGLWLSVVAVLLTSGTLSGCNTIEGAGEDIEDLGDAIEDEAEDQRRDR